GRTSEAATTPDFSQWGQNAYNTQTLELGQADITIPTPTVGSDGSIKFDIQVKALYNLPDTTILHVAVIEQSVLVSELAQAQTVNIKTGEDSINYVLKKMLPNASGTKFGTALGIGQSRTFTGFEYYPDASKLYKTANDLAIIVFLQHESKKNVYQTELITGLLDPPVVTGLENSELLANLEVYPNPANNEFTIRLPGPAKQSMELQLVDQVGKVVTKDSILEGTSRKTINSRELAAGIYILQIGSGKSGVVRKKILVVHQD
ncbi:MAG: T9SS type A sorting domain-containing protein, partial [Bacteroidia bacterium]|nr:T9SS type A sorting domain-containing protein [Bacteroidia bacterium]